MKLAFCLFKYFPYGGLQRDFVRIAKVCQQRGHEIHVFTMDWEGEQPLEFNLHLIPRKGWQNHTRSMHFAQAVREKIKHLKMDLVIGFNKMPYLDIYYAADICYQVRANQRHWLYRILPRYKQLLAFESAVFGLPYETDVMLISARQEIEYQYCYGTPDERLHLLPPGIAKDRLAPSNASVIRHRVRHELQIADSEFLLLAIGSGFKTKGLDRTLNALAALPSELKQRCQLFVIGKDKADRFIRLAKELKIENRVHFLGGRDDIPQWLLAGDLLLHPAYHENTGTVLLEALAAGLPVATVDSCGYAHYISQANAGVVLESPFNQVDYNQALQNMLLSPHPDWRKNGIHFAQTVDLYSLPEQAVNLIEKIGQERAS